MRTVAASDETSIIVVEVTSGYALVKTHRAVCFTERKFYLCENVYT